MLPLMYKPPTAASLLQGKLHRLSSKTTTPHPNTERISMQTLAPLQEPITLLQIKCTAHHTCVSTSTFCFKMAAFALTIFEQKVSHLHLFD